VLDKVSFSLNLILKKLKPRYTITSVGDFFYERMPYVNSSGYLSRFINLAYFPSPLKKNLKEKFLYAAQLKPVNKMQLSELNDLSGTEHTPDVFKLVSEKLQDLLTQKNKKIKISKEELYVGNLDRSTSYEEIYDFLKRFGDIEYLNMMNDRKDKFLGHCFVKFNNIQLHDNIIKQSNMFSLKGRKVIIGEKVEKDENLEDIEKRCWFCFNNPSIDSDLILKQFTDFYLAYPKGPCDDFHFLLIPKKHIKCFIDLNKTQKKEFTDILQILINLLKDNNLDYLIYEKNLPYKDEAQKHMIINIVGIGKEFSFHFLDHMQNVFNEANIKYREHDSKVSLSELIQGDSNYYYIDAPTGIQFGRSGVRTKIIVDVNKHTKDYNDYPRKIICLLNDTEVRIYWKNADINKEFLVKLKDKLMKYYK
jgi:RNA recognition motif-containing protein